MAYDPHLGISTDGPELVAAVVAAVGDKRGPKGGGKGQRSRSSSPAAKARDSFPKETCYHCGEKGHSRTKGKLGKNKPCPAFAKLLRDNGDKLPSGYKGAFEKHVEAYKAKMAKGAPKVAALTEEHVLQLLNEDSDSSDESDIGLTCGAVWQTVGPKSSNPFSPDRQFPSIIEASTAPKRFNAFKVLQEADPENPCFDDAYSPDHAADDLKTWAHKVSRTSDRKSKTWKIETDADIKKLENLLCGASNKRSENALRKLQESTDIDDLANLIERKSSTAKSIGRVARRVWAMVDSGSFVTIANCAKAFPGHTVRPSAGSKNGVTYSNASGGDIPNRGEITITHQLDDVSELDIPFQDGDVQVPIISVKDFVHRNSVVKFKRNGGTIKLPSGTVLRFMEKFGVYFICLNIVSGNVNDSATLVDKIIEDDHRDSINAIDRAIKILGPSENQISTSVSDTDGPPTPTTDVVGRVRFDLPPPCSDDHCRDRCCRRGLVKRPGRKSAFHWPEP